MQHRLGKEMTHLSEEGWRPRQVSLVEGHGPDVLLRTLPVSMGKDTEPRQRGRKPGMGVSQG